MNRLKIYNWQQKDWTDFRYDHYVLGDLLIAIAGETGLVSGWLAGLSEDIGVLTLQGGGRSTHYLVNFEH